MGAFGGLGPYLRGRKKRRRRLRQLRRLTVQGRTFYVRPPTKKGRR